MRTGDERRSVAAPSQRLRERMSRREFLVWLKYREKYGPLNIMMRTEWGASLVASVPANINKAKNTPPFKVK